MVKPDIHAIHQRLETMGIPVDFVHLQRDGKTVDVGFLATASDDQRKAAQTVVDEWDQAAIEREKQAGRDAQLLMLPTVEAINAAKKPDELRAIALELRQFIDGVH